MKTPANVRAALEYALNLWGVRYVYGAEADMDSEKPGALDCSEMTELIYNHVLGIKLPDGARFQHAYMIQNGRMLPDGETPQPLDLVFLWDRERTRISHVGLIFGQMQPVGGIMVLEARGNPYNRVMFCPLAKWRVDFGERIAGIYRHKELENILP